MVKRYIPAQKIGIWRPTSPSEPAHRGASGRGHRDRGPAAMRGVPGSGLWSEVRGQASVADAESPRASGPIRGGLPRSGLDLEDADQPREIGRLEAEHLGRLRLAPPRLAGPPGGGSPPRGPGPPRGTLPPRP